MNQQNNDLFTPLSKLNVLIVGDVMIDRYWQGKVNRISPEAPVPVVELQQTEDRLGGAANVALNIRAMGATPYLFTVLGEDTEGSNFLKLLTVNDLSNQGVVYSAYRKTTVKTRIMAGTHQMLRIDSETTADLDAPTEDEFMKRLRDFLDLNAIHALIFQDYNKGVLTPKLISEVMDEAIKRGIPTAVDPKRTNFFAYKNATLFKPNLKEIRDAAPFEVRSDLAALHQADNFLREKLNNQLTMITLSDKGMYLSGQSLVVGRESLEDSNFNKTNDQRLTTNDSKGVIFPTKTRHIADVSGAGDTVISVAALGLAAGWSVEEIGVISNLAGSQVCEKAGVVPVDLEQLKLEFRQTTNDF